MEDNKIETGLTQKEADELDLEAIYDHDNGIQYQHVEIGSTTLRLFNSTSNSRLEDETFEEYKFRRKLVKQGEKVSKLGVRWFWKSVRMPVKGDKLRESRDNSWGTYNKKVVEQRYNELKNAQNKTEK